MLAIQLLNFGLGQAESRQLWVQARKEHVDFPERATREPHLKRGRIWYAREAQGRMGVCREVVSLKTIGPTSQILCDLPDLEIWDILDSAY